VLRRLIVEFERGRSRFRWPDVVAGLSVALVLVPQSLAYAQLAGMPTYRGLYAAAVPPLAAAAFASSPYLQPGPTAVTALLTLGALTPLAAVGSASYVSLGLLLAFVVGIARLAVGLLRAGVVAYLLSQPMLIGFVPAAAILIVASQLPVAFGATPPPGGVLAQAAWTVSHPDRWHTSAIVISLLAAAMLALGPRVHPLLPSVLIVVVLGYAYSVGADYTGAKIGHIPTALPPVSLDLPWSRLPALIVPGVVIALVGFGEIASIARTYATLDRRPWNANREFVAQGVANLAAGVTGGFPVGGSFSRSALNRLAGAKTAFSSAVTGLALLAFLPVAGFLSPLPKAVLATVVILAVVGLVRLRPLLDTYRYSPYQFAIAAATFAATLALAPHIERALLIGIALAIGVHLLLELRIQTDVTEENEILHLQPRGVLWFGSARVLEDAFVQLLADHPNSRRLVVHLDALGRIDLTGALTLRSLLENAREAGLEAEIEGVPPAARRVMRRVMEHEDLPRPINRP